MPVGTAIDENEDVDMDIVIDAAAVETEDGSLDAQDQNQEDAESSTANTTSQPNKKLKQKNKRAALMQKLVESSIPVSPYSKSYNRRLKRKQKQSMGLDSMTAALDDAVPDLSMAMLPESSSATSTRPVTSNLSAQPAPPESFLAKRTRTENKQLTQKAKTAQGKIGEDTVHKSMSARQRQKMLNEERNRLPAVLAHKSFSANPFETIRLHAQNTIVPLEKSRKPQH